MSDTNDLLIELGLEELPSMALKPLQEAFSSLIEHGLQDKKLDYQFVESFVSPRRLALIVKDLSAKQTDQTIARKGPQLAAAFNEDGSLTKAGEGFARSCGLTAEDLNNPEYHQDGRLVYQFEQTGESLEQLFPTLLTESLKKLPIKKRMRWGVLEDSFVRPVHWLVVLYGNTVIPMELYGIEASNETRGHRFMANQAITIRSADEYESTLEKASVVASFAKRQQRIETQLTEAAGTLMPVIPAKLLEEVTGLVEWPVVLKAAFDARFLQVPKEVLIKAMQSHQKAFALTDANGALANQFLLVSNIESKNPSAVIKGNEKVMHARLADAEFFFKKDKLTPLKDRIEDLKAVVYQQSLGSLYDKTARIAGLAKHLAQLIDANPEMVNQGAWLAKADLTSDMVGEFPELQGVMGAYYAKASNEDDIIATAIGEHYKPAFADDTIPDSDEGAIIAIADKLDTIVGIFSIGKGPTGEKDPFGLRRSALGVLRILLEKQLDVDLAHLVDFAAGQYQAFLKDANVDRDAILTFILERLRRWNTDQGLDVKIFNAVMANKPTHPLDLQKRIQAVASFVSLSEAESLIAANKRVSNILKKQNIIEIPKFDSQLLNVKEEVALANAVSTKQTEIKPFYAQRDYQQALQTLSELQAPVDAFFDNVLVMDEDEATKNNRIALLGQLRGLFLDIADLSLL